jgi:adenosylcobinamide-phosphate synthase
VAGALGRQLGGTLRYGSRTEHRPTLGTGPRPEPADVRAAIALVDRTERLLVAALALPALPGAARSVRRLVQGRR